MSVSKTDALPLGHTPIYIYIYKNKIDKNLNDHEKCHEYKVNLRLQKHKLELLLPRVQEQLKQKVLKLEHNE
jgi:hypothetical protein